MPYWCVARLEPNREAVARHFLQAGGYEIYFPKVREKRLYGRRRVERVSLLFPCYGFVSVTNGWHSARWTIGVAALIMRGDRPAEVADEVIEGLRLRERAGVVVLPDRAAPFKVGDRVRVTAGAMCGLEGLVAGMRSHERIAVLLQALGRVELPREAVEVI
jgi:transcriptional antiterminator RfaH